MVTIMARLYTVRIQWKITSRGRKRLTGIQNKEEERVGVAILHESITPNIGPCTSQVH